MPLPPLQIQARALGDPTRHAIYRYLADAAGPVGVAELTDHLGLNHNAIRQHLAKLVAAQLVVEATAAPNGRGRPRLEYALDPAGEGRWAGVGPYERLSVLLAEVVGTGDAPSEVGRRAALADPPAGAADPVAGLVAHMARQGFEPRVSRRGNAIDVVLDACPFTSAVLADPDTVCEVHLGLARGYAEASGGLVVDELVPKDPRRAGCRLRCHVTPES